MIRSVFASTLEERRQAFKSRAFLDGVEVTADCQVADDEAGRVMLLKRNAEGQHYQENGDPAYEWKYGHVEIRPKESE